MPLGFIGENVMYCYLEILYLRGVSKYVLQVWILLQFRSDDLDMMKSETNSICLSNRQESLFSVNLKGSRPN